MLWYKNGGSYLVYKDVKTIHFRFTVETGENSKCEENERSEFNFHRNFPFPDKLPSRYLEDSRSVRSLGVTSGSFIEDESKARIVYNFQNSPSIDSIKGEYVY